MISFGTKEYYNGSWFIIRSWDGIDKPDYIKVFEIQPNELAFKDGRFKNYNHKHYKNKIDLTHNNVDLEKIITWISENINDNWFLDIDEWYGSSIKTKTSIFPGKSTFYFDKEENAVAFKLVWA